MIKYVFFLFVCFSALLTPAFGFWLFSDDDDEKRPRVADLMESASLIIDEASDFAEDGKNSEAVATYRRALEELDRIELENSERAQTAEFATLRNKRAYVNAAIDSLHLKQAKQNARAVSVTDTSALEKKYARKKKGNVISKEEAKEVEKKEENLLKALEVVEEAIDNKKALTTEIKTAKAEIKREINDIKTVAESVKTPEISPNLTDRHSRLILATHDFKAKDFDAALLTLSSLLQERPDDAAALNLRAAIEMEQGKFREAERTLDQSIQSHPRSYYAYYNMARLFLRSRGEEGKASAKRYYETGRSLGGSVDATLESSFK